MLQSAPSLLFLAHCCIAACSKISELGNEPLWLDNFKVVEICHSLICFSSWPHITSRTKRTAKAQAILHDCRVMNKGRL